MVDIGRDPWRNERTTRGGADLPIFLRVLAIAAAVTAVTLVSPTDSGAIAPFDPGGFACFETYETEEECDGEPTPGASSDIRLRFCIGWNDYCTSEDVPVVDSAPALVVGFLPLGFTPIEGNAVPIGTIAGRAEGEQAVGVNNNPCNIRRSLSWAVLSGSVDPLDEIDGSSAAAVFFDGDGNGVQDGVDHFPSFLNYVLAGAQPRARYVGLNFSLGIVTMVNALVLDPGASVHTSTGELSFDSSLGYPVVLLVGDPTVEPSPGPISDFCAPFFADLVIFGTAVDNPCTPTPVDGAACPGGATPVFENRGYPLLPCETGNEHDEDADGAVNDGCPQVNLLSEADIPGACDNAISDDGEDSDVNDGCPQVGALSEGQRLPGGCSAGDEGGCAVLNKPSLAGTYHVTAFSVGYHDADGDGIENQLDVCALIPNSGWNPRAIDTLGDPDQDGLPSECDPAPTSPSDSISCHPVGFSGRDEDLDCFSNRLDNCPLVNQLVNPLEPPHEVFNPPTQTDTDHDGIGDICDPDPQIANGERPAACLSMPVVVGVGASTEPLPPAKDFSGFDCVGGFTLFPQDPDIDGDGICTEGIDPGDSGCTGIDNCPSVANPSQADEDSDGTGDACENQPPLGVGGFAGLAPDALPPPASDGGASATLPIAATLAAAGAFALGGGAWLALRRRR